MINTTNWKEFKVSDIFKLYHGSRLTLENRVPGKTPFITAGEENKGITNYISNYRILYKNPITIDMFGNTFYHNLDLDGDDNVYFLVNNDLNQNIKLYIATIISKHLKNKYNYSKQFRQKTLDDLIILLPTKNDQPDFDYMEEYIEEIKLKYIDTLEKNNNEHIDKALKITGLSYQDLNKDLTVKPADRYEEFRIGNLFEINSSKKIYHANQIIIYDKQIEGAHPYIVRSENNRGVRGFIKESEDNLNDKMTLSFAQDTFVAYFQPFKYFTGNKVKILKPKYNINENIFLYLETAINKAIKSFSWGSGSTEDTISNIKILLPVIDKDTPDFDYMEKAIYIYILQRRLNLKNYLTKKK